MINRNVSELAISAVVLVSGMPATPTLRLGGWLSGLDLMPVARLDAILAGDLPSFDALPEDILAIIPI
ncbi:hypothetical protein [Zhongshania sp. BJYM1]|uniref:hypothetical protein n=1 Tax=Zhongshania aquatica TaxID=2965069 RepID=UPI0022B57F74|nr:hypothetical protein [Marortus sp. BJYM1]